MIDREFCRREDAAQLTDPVGTLNFTQALIQSGPLPIGVVRVLKRDRGKSSGLNVAAGFPEKGEFLPEEADGPSVGNETVECQRQDMHALFEDQHSHSE
jgi:hypothetical protein